ncbi:LA-RELATED PROTEIN 6B-LIKE [Salix koriyanagi]|uniref:LA-RELATED PROTEIN 6B-LIKE n=1 Tax=Salix koriyanagi TaxID=2511006 RepID=A0A9Q0UPM0_9ROSI|nr:LA-RELATED PROTEIN 6B-LIKE [Salix koriyanagi]
MAQQNQEEEEELAVVESVPESLDQSSSSSSDPSLSRNISFSKLNAQAPAFVPTRPQSQPPPPPRMTVIPPPPPPPAAMMHMYPPPSPFHVPIPSPVHLPHVIPVQNHHHLHHNHHHNGHNHHQNHQQHHNQHQQYVPVRNHNQFHQQHNSKKVQQHSDEEVEVVGNKDTPASSDHAAKSDSKSDDAVNKLLNQVEYYFSDLNLATTDHLMRFITKDPEGYVPISVVASFKKVKAAINSNSQLATILRNSTKLVVSDDGKKVRRQHPLTDSEVEELQSRIVVAENLPEDHCHQNLMKIFSAVGSVKTIRTCPPQTSGGGGSSASRSAKADGMHFSNKLHAFVEYETVEIAEKAVAELNDEGNWRSGLRVRLMLSQARGKKGNDGQGPSEEDEVSASEQITNVKRTEDVSQQHDAHLHEHSQGEDHVNDKEGAQRKGRNRGEGKGTWARSIS